MSVVVAPEEGVEKVLYWTEYHQLGLAKGRRLAARLLDPLYRLRFGTEMPAACREAVAALPVDALLALGNAMVDFTDPSEVDAWIAARSPVTEPR